MSENELTEQKWLEDCRAYNNWQVEQYRAVLASGQSALRAAFLMNGGAAVAILAFLGQLVARNASSIPDFGQGLFFVLGGVAATGLATGATYLATAFDADPSERRWTRNLGKTFNFTAILLGVVAHAMFISGVLSSYWALKEYA